MTPRHLTYALVVCAGLSLSVLPNAARVTGGEAAPELPMVSAGPARQPVATDLDPDAPLVETVVRHLAASGSSLSPGEIVHLARVLVEESGRHGLDAGLVLAVIEVESRFDPFAVSGAGAKGLMQLMPATARALARREGIQWQGQRTLFDPVTNVRLGIAYLAELRERFGPWRTALTAYNWGPAKVGRMLREGGALPARYSRKVLSAWERGTEDSTDSSRSS